MKRTLIIISGISLLLGLGGKWITHTKETPPSAPTASELKAAAPTTTTSSELAPPISLGEKTQRQGFDSFDTERLIQGLAEHTPPELLPLVEAIYNAKTPEEKGRAADQLGGHGGAGAVLALMTVAALQDNPSERSLVLDGLNNMNDPEGFRTLATTLAATYNAQFLDIAMQHLSRTNSPEVLETLVSLYRERNDSAKQKSTVLEAIARLRHPDLHRRLTKIANTAEEPALVEAAQKAITSFPTASDPS